MECPSGGTTSVETSTPVKRVRFDVPPVVAERRETPSIVERRDAPSLNERRDASTLVERRDGSTPIERGDKSFVATRRDGYSRFGRKLKPKKRFDT
jgi:hypothetical protein